MGNGHPVAAWSTRSIAPARQFSSWREAVSETHLAWDMPGRRVPAFRALIKPRMLGAASVIECACDPCHGRRGATEIGRSSDAYYGVLYLVRGQEAVRQGGREARLQAGDLTLWDSTRPIDFAIDGPLHKITLLIPQALLDVVLPRAYDRIATVVSGRTGCGALLASHLRALAREGQEVPAASLPLLLGATLDLLASALGQDVPGAPAHQAALLARIRAFVLDRLHEPGLAPAQIAGAHGISLRQLHRVFEATGCSVERWIWQQRLLRCHRELLKPAAATISDVAFRWGFSDAAHFSRAFKAQFGLTPRQLRRQAADAVPIGTPQRVERGAREH
jgi:AraC-like DNA-binding protein